MYVVIWTSLQHCAILCHPLAMTHDLTRSLAPFSQNRGGEGRVDRFNRCRVRLRRCSGSFEPAASSRHTPRPMASARRRRMETASYCGPRPRRRPRSNAASRPPRTGEPVLPAAAAAAVRGGSGLWVSLAWEWGCCPRPPFHPRRRLRWVDTRGFPRLGPIIGSRICFRRASRGTTVLAQTHTGNYTLCSNFLLRF